MKLKDIPGVMLGKKEKLPPLHRCNMTGEYIGSIGATQVRSEIAGYNQSQEEQGEVEVVIDSEGLKDYIGNYFDGMNAEEICEMKWCHEGWLAEALSDNLPSILKVKK